MQTEIKGSKRIAVTGPTGFIGLHLVRLLHERGHSPICIIGPGKRTECLDDLGFPTDRIHVQDITQIGDAVRASEPDYVIHLSAYVSTERSLHSLEETMKWNLLSSISLLTACAEIGVKRVVLMGSCEEYGQNISPFDPLVAPDPPSPYAASKAAATCYARMFYSSFKLDTVVLRPSVVYGPGQSPRMLIPQVMKALAEGRVIDVTEGKQTRDFVYVSDVVEGIVRALTVPDIGGDVWNIGSGEIVTVRNCLERIEALTARRGLIDYGRRPYNDREIFHYEPSIDKTTQVFQWRPSVALDEGLQKTWESYTVGPPNDVISTVER